MRYLLSLLLPLTFMLGACDAAKIATAQVDTKTPQQSVFVAKTAYGVALRLATTYANLPRCGQPTSPAICSDRAVLDQMRKADLAADAAISNAEGAVRTLGSNPALVSVVVMAADASVKAFQDIVNVYAPK